VSRRTEKRVDPELGRHAAAFVLVNVFLWIVWALTAEDKSGLPWPVWGTLSWGFVLAWHASQRLFRAKRDDEGSGSQE
jgi:2TM domain